MIVRIHYYQLWLVGGIGRYRRGYNIQIQEKIQIQERIQHTDIGEDTTYRYRRGYYIRIQERIQDTDTGEDTIYRYKRG